MLKNRSVSKVDVGTLFPPLGEDTQDNFASTTTISRALWQLEKGDLTERLERGRFSAVVKVNISLPALMGVF